MTTDYAANRGTLFRYADWWPPVLIIVLLVPFWVAVIRRAGDNDARAVRDAEVIQANVAQTVVNHTGQLVEWIRLFNSILTTCPHPETARAVVNAALGSNGAFLRLMQFDADGRLLMSIGKLPEPWLRQAAMSFAVSVKSDSSEPSGSPSVKRLTTKHRRPGFCRCSIGRRRPGIHRVIFLSS